MERNDMNGNVALEWRTDLGYPGSEFLHTGLGHVMAWSPAGQTGETMEEAKDRIEIAYRASAEAKEIAYDENLKKGIFCPWFDASVVQLLPEGIDSGFPDITSAADREKFGVRQVMLGQGYLMPAEDFARVWSEANRTAEHYGFDFDMDDAADMLGQCAARGSDVFRYGPSGESTRLDLGSFVKIGPARGDLGDAGLNRAFEMAGGEFQEDSQRGPEQPGI